MFRVFTEIMTLTDLGQKILKLIYRFDVPGVRLTQRHGFIFWIFLSYFIVSLRQRVDSQTYGEINFLCPNNIPILRKVNRI